MLKEWRGLQHKYMTNFQSMAVVVSSRLPCTATQLAAGLRTESRVQLQCAHSPGFIAFYHSTASPGSNNLNVPTPLAWLTCVLEFIAHKMTKFRCNTHYLRTTAILQPHPTDSLLATSGIENVVRLWSPLSGPAPEEGVATPAEMQVISYATGLQENGSGGRLGLRSSYPE